MGVHVHVLRPGESNGYYHAEAAQEGFLVLSGECVAVIENEERRMRRWDYFHSPAGTEHITVGAGDEPCVILMFGSPGPSRDIEWIANETAAKHGASVARTTGRATEAYGELPEPCAYAHRANSVARLLRGTRRPTQPTRPKSRRSSPSCAPPETAHTAGGCAAGRGQLRRTAAAAGVRRRFAPHQLRHAHAVEMAREGRAADRHPTPARPQQPRHHLRLPPGHRQRRDDRHRPRPTRTDDPRQPVAPTLENARFSRECCSRGVSARLDSPAHRCDRHDRL